MTNSSAEAETIQVEILSIILHYVKGDRNIAYRAQYAQLQAPEPCVQEMYTQSTKEREERNESFHSDSE